MVCRHWRHHTQPFLPWHRQCIIHSPWAISHLQRQRRCAGKLSGHFPLNLTPLLLDISNLRAKVFICNCPLMPVTWLLRRLLAAGMFGRRCIRIVPASFGRYLTSSVIDMSLDVTMWFSLIQISAKYRHNLKEELGVVWVDRSGEKSGDAVLPRCLLREGERCVEQSTLRWLGGELWFLF